MSKMDSLEDFLYYLFAILLLVSFFTIIWIFFNQLQIRALYRNNLPNHKDLLNTSSNQILNPTINSTESNTDLPNASQTVKQTSQYQFRERRLPITILPYDNKPIVSNKNDIIKKCKQIHQQRDQKQASSSISFTSSSITPITTHSESDLSKKVKNQASQNEQKLKTKETEEKRKREEEKKAKKAQIDQQAKEEAEKAKSLAPAAPILGASGLGTGGSGGSLLGGGSGSTSFSFNLNFNKS